MVIIACEMEYANALIERTDIVCIPIEASLFQEYKRIYNECFYEMRKALDIQPYHFLHDYKQIADKVQDIYLLINQGEIIGSVACYGNEIDDLIVNPKYQHKGYGKQLLLWAMQHIRERSNDPITLHVAQWNHDALMLYKKVGFEIAHYGHILPHVVCGFCVTGNHGCLHQSGELPSYAGTHLSGRKDALSDGR